MCRLRKIVGVKISWLFVVILLKVNSIGNHATMALSMQWILYVTFASSMVITFVSVLQVMLGLHDKMVVVANACVYGVSKVTPKDTLTTLTKKMIYVD